MDCGILHINYYVRITSKASTWSFRRVTSSQFKFTLMTGFKSRTFSVHLSALSTELPAFQTHEMLIKRFLPFRVVGANALNGVWTLLKVFDPDWCLLRLMRICILPTAEMPSEASLAPECHGPGPTRPSSARPGPVGRLCHRWTRRWTFFSHRDNFELRIFSSQADNYLFEKWSLEALDAIIAQLIKDRQAYLDNENGST